MNFNMIRKLEIKDAQLMLAAMSDDNVNHFMNIDGKKMKLDDCIKFIEKSKNDSINTNFAIVDESDSWVGTISLKNIDKTSMSAEYAIITSSSVHGKGYAKKATKEILNYAFNVLNLNRVYLNVSVENERANAFYKKVGFIYEGCSRKSHYIKGKLTSLNWYSLLKEEFLYD